MKFKMTQLKETTEKLKTRAENLKIEISKYHNKWEAIDTSTKQIELTMTPKFKKEDIANRFNDNIHSTSNLRLLPRIGVWCPKENLQSPAIRKGEAGPFEKD